MGQHGLWQQGEIGPYLPMDVTNIDANNSDMLSEYLNTNFNQYQEENYGIVYITSLQSFFYLYIKPRIIDGKFIKSYSVLLEIEINKLLCTFMILEILKDKIGVFLQDAHFLDKEGNFEDIVKKFNALKFMELLNVSTVKEETKMIDSVRLTRFPNITDVFAHLLNMKHIYILDDESNQVEIIIHLLNIFLGEIIDVRSQFGKLSFPIHLIKNYSENYIHDRMETDIIIKPKDFELLTNLEKNIHHEEFKTFDASDMDKFILLTKGYFQQAINDYYHLIRAFTTGKKLSKPKLRSFANNFSFLEM